MALKTLKSQVEQILKVYPEARDSDITLMLLLWQNYFHSSIVSMQNGTQYVALRSLYELPREDNIKRIRAKFQNEEGKYLPTKLEIALKRGILENQWREFMGYAPPDPNHYVEKEPMEEEKPKEVPQELQPNILIKCPKCGGGMRKALYSDETREKPVERIKCLKCGHQL